MIVGTLLLALLLLTILYAMRTLVGMRHRRFYPLIRYRRSVGSPMPLSTQLMDVPSQSDIGH